MAKIKPIIDISVLIKAQYPSLKCLNFVEGTGENGSSEERVHSVLEISLDIPGEKSSGRRNE